MSLHQKTKPKRRTKILAPEIAPVITVPIKPPRPWKKRLWRWFWRVGLLALLAIGLIIAGLYLSQPRYYKVLIIGSDQRNHEHARSDVLMILAVPKSSKDSMSLITIPRDTKIDHPTKGLQKITHFYAMWEDPSETLGNRELTQSVVEELLDVKMDATVEVTFESFDEIIDLFGGVDTSEGHLTGAEAEELVHNRFVQPNGDFGRAAAQREIVEQLLKQAKQPKYAKAVYDYFQTSDRARLTVNRSQAMLFGAAYVLGHKGKPNFTGATEKVLPGHSEMIYTPAFDKKLYYWILDEGGTTKIVDDSLR